MNDRATVSLADRLAQISSRPEAPQWLVKINAADWPQPTNRKRIAGLSGGKDSVAMVVREATVRSSRQIAALKRAGEMLEGYEFKTEPRPAPRPDYGSYGGLGQATDNSYFPWPRRGL